MSDLGEILQQGGVEALQRQIERVIPAAVTPLPPSDGDRQRFVPLARTPEPERFPTSLLPRWMATWVREEAEASQVPEDLPAMLALGVCAAAAGGKARVEVMPSWHEPLNLFLAVALESGSNKSAVFGHALAPLHAMERRRNDETAEQRRQAEIDREVLARSLRVATAKAGRARGEAQAELIAEARAIRNRLEAIGPSAPTRLVVGDATPEAIVHAMAQQGGRLTWASDEAEPLSLMTGRYGTGPNFDFALKAHVGQPIRVDRVGRAPLHIPNPCLSIVVTVQPTVIRSFAKLPGDVLGKGLVPRFLFAVPRSRIGTRTLDAPAVREVVAQGYHAHVTRLLELPVTESDNVPSLLLDEAAESEFRAFYAAIEQGMAPGGDLVHIRAWASKSRGAVARLAGLLYLADGGSVETTATGSLIGAETMERAVGIGRYLMSHAQVAYGMMQADPQVRRALRVWDFVGRAAKTDELGRRWLSKRGLFEKAKGTFPKAADLDAPLRLLAEHGYIHPVPTEQDRKRRGRKPSPRWFISPEADHAAG